LGKFYFKKMKKFLISILVIFIIILIAGMTYWYKNQPIIQDLGNGWKSYFHPQIGFTVKIPSDAEGVFKLQGDKNEHSVVYFSKGLINTISSSEHSDYEKNSENYYNQIYLDRNERSVVESEEEAEWKTTKQSRISRYKINRKRNFLKKFIIDDKEILISFEEYEIGNTEEDVLLNFKTNSILIADKTRNHGIYLDGGNFIRQKIDYENSFHHQITVTPDHLHYTQEEIERFIEQDVEKIKELIISIDNF